MGECFDGGVRLTGYAHARLAGFQEWLSAVPRIGWVSEGDDGCDDIIELIWQAVLELLAAPPSRPSLLADLPVVGEDLVERCAL